MTKLLSPEEWSTYWHEGNLTSFHGDFRGNYQGVFQDFWTRVFATLSRDSSILDLGCGNGILALRAQTFSANRQSGFHVTAIDSADIDPRRDLNHHPELVKSLAHIDFRGNTPMEQTGLSDGSYQLAIAQFGLEYGDPLMTAAELNRLLDPVRGAVVALLHHRDSKVLAQVQDRLREAKHCDNSGMAGLAGRLIDLDEQTAHSPQLIQRVRQQAQQIKQQLDQAQTRLGRFSQEIRSAAHIPFFVAGLGRILDRRLVERLDAAQRRDALAEFMARHRTIIKSLQDLRDAALDDARLDQLQQQLRRQGFGLQRVTSVRYDNNFVCLALLAQRDAVNPIGSSALEWYSAKEKRG